MDTWVWWILTCGFSLYFVILLLEFNRPAQKLAEQIENADGRRHDMERRLERAKEEVSSLRSRVDELQVRWDGLEERRKEILAEANMQRMARVPAGPFTMGGREEDSPRGERPARIVYMPTYYMAKYPVTNQDYSEFVRCTGHRAPIHWQRGTFPAGTSRHPVVNVTWQEARAYAAWSGARLPTEAEWEKAARGTDDRNYPWGNRFTEGERCNGNNDVGTTTPVNEYPDGRSPYGVWDMCGNVYEWCSDYYDEDYYKTAPSSDPRGPEGGQERVVRGGCFFDTRTALRVTHRHGVSEVTVKDNTGFRLAMDADRAPGGSADRPG